jgi:oligopeptide transport system substrate-binding protein
MKMNSKILGGLVATALIAGVTYKMTQKSSTSGPAVVAGLKGVDVERKSVALNFLDEPKVMDAQKADDEVGIMLLSHVAEGLMRNDPQNNPIPGLAESYEMKSPTHYVFKLRSGITWSDGKPIVAQDFVFAWRRGLSKELASEYAFMLYPLKNGRDINAGKKPAESLAVKALDEKTLDVELESPTGYFLRILGFPTYQPAREDFVTAAGPQYAADADKLLFSGPYVIAEWKHNSNIRLVKNEKYWNKANIAINEINMPYLIRDDNSEFNMFKEGKYGIMRTISKELLPDAQANKLQIRKYNPGTVWYFQMNTTRKVTGNVHLRKAMQLAMNRAEFATQVTGIPGVKPAFGLIPDYMPGVQKTFGEEVNREFKDGDIEAAKTHLEMAKKELGLSEIPELDLLASDTTTTRRDAEYFQRYFKEKLGVQIKLDFQTFKVRLERSSRKDFDLVISGWGPDYMDAMSFADLFTSWNGNNNTGWSNAEYDNLIKNAMASVDAKERIESMAAADKILIEQAPILPYIQASRVYVQDPRLVGVVRNQVGADPDFYFAKIVDSVATK